MQVMPSSALHDPAFKRVDLTTSQLLKTTSMHWNPSQQDAPIESEFATVLEQDLTIGKELAQRQETFKKQVQTQASIYKNIQKLQNEYFITHEKQARMSLHNKIDDQCREMKISYRCLAEESKQRCVDQLKNQLIRKNVSERVIHEAIALCEKHMKYAIDQLIAGEQNPIRNYYDFEFKPVSYFTEGTIENSILEYQLMYKKIQEKLKLLLVEQTELNNPEVQMIQKAISLEQHFFDIMKQTQHVKVFSILFQDIRSFFTLRILQKDLIDQSKQRIQQEINNIADKNIQYLQSLINKNQNDRLEFLLEEQMKFKQSTDYFTTYDKIKQKNIEKAVDDIIQRDIGQVKIISKPETIETVQLIKRIIEIKRQSIITDSRAIMFELQGQFRALKMELEDTVRDYCVKQKRFYLQEIKGPIHNEANMIIDQIQKIVIGLFTQLDIPFRKCIVEQYITYIGIDPSDSNFQQVSLDLLSKDSSKQSEKLYQFETKMQTIVSDNLSKQSYFAAKECLNDLRQILFIIALDSTQSDAVNIIKQESQKTYEIILQIADQITDQNEAEELVAMLLVEEDIKDQEFDSEQAEMFVEEYLDKRRERLEKAREIAKKY
ncbi:Hypothetical_protein [Hexamita inflata]|uniref:Hypothetical_protein n=1 Tax=Hexamita inflata TaxID=28002 RepID=A0AA86TX76_9EUKA|nr:Hypothetical protein HINF_LOCUS19396 [Hexamita inflata]